jgi:uncharacterized membrane protein
MQPSTNHTQNESAPSHKESSHNQRYREEVAGVQKSLKKRADENRGFGDRLADKLTALFGSMPFLTLNVVWFLLWMVINFGLIPFIPVFDPFPFGLLTMIVSLEAIVLAIVVLISQNREAQIADLREELTVLYNEVSEREVTKVLQLLTLSLRHQGVDLSGDEELPSMLEEIDTEKIIRNLAEEVMSDEEVSENE